MQLTTVKAGLAAAILANTVSADFLSAMNKDLGISNRAKVVNNCGYSVYLWSVLHEDGCNPDDAKELTTGQSYEEEFRQPVDKKGVSIKISKTKQCKGVDITQLEYYLEQENRAYSSNYLDVSYVDCLGGNCPGRKDGYYLQSGPQNRAAVADANNPICPTFQCSNQEECDKTSYVNWDDVQTKSCGLDQPLDFYLCGLDAQGGNGSAQPSQPSSNNKVAEKPQPPPKEEEKPIEKLEEPPKPVVTPAPAPEEVKKPNVKTEVVYVTKYEYVNAKRHAHNHARRHFRA